MLKALLSKVPMLFPFSNKDKKVLSPSKSTFVYNENNGFKNLICLPVIVLSSFTLTAGWPTKVG